MPHRVRETKIFTRRRDVIGEIDLEQAGIELLRSIQIVDRNRGVKALRVGHGPLLELVVLGAQHQHQPAGADDRALLLDGDADVLVVHGDVDDVGVLQQVDAVRQQITQRRLRQRIDVLRGELAVAHRQRRSVGDHRDRGRRVIFETHLAGLLDIEVALGLGAVRPDLDEISDQRVQRRQIGADLGGLRLLVGVEGRENIGGHVAARIGNDRIRHDAGRRGRQRRLLLRRRHLHAVAGFWRGFWNRHGLRRCCAGHRRRPTARPSRGAHAARSSPIAGPDFPMFIQGYVLRA